jgi:tRNA 5-methylaminomethyl-2-thiouridine biosynthesis bifunctional protein
MSPSKTAVIIGGGIAGCSTAHALAKRGIKVTLFERQEQLASEASGNPIAMLYPRLSGENTASQFALASFLYSLSHYQSLALSQSNFNRCGMLQLGFNARELARIQKVASTTPKEIAHLLTAEKASQLAGIPIQHQALYFPQAAWVDTKALCSALVAHKNISVITSKNIDNIIKNNDYFEIYSDKKLCTSADVVLIANANSIRSFSQTAHLTTQAVRGQVSFLNENTHNPMTRTIICSDGYFSPARNGTHSLGATFSTDNQDSTVTTEYHIENLAKLKYISTDAYNTLKNNIVGGRTSFRCVTQDHFPMVGELLNNQSLINSPPRPSATNDILPWHSGLYVNIAHGSHGFITAPLSAEILGNLICREPLVIDSTLTGLLNPNRFSLRALGLKKLAKMVASSK